jgi:dTDP-4-amino-4,6-dideoxygalactose transaminase
MHVPLLDLTAQYAPLRDEVLAAITRVCDSQRFILGAEVDTFERELAGQLGVAHAIGVSSGTDAILAALMALDIGPGDEVVTPTYSFFATAGCVARVGARPVLVDVDPATLNMTAESLERAITPRTKAVIPVHLYGQMVDMDPLVAVARRHKIAVIEDACQAIGSTDRGRQAGSIGDCGCFSFFPSKNLGAFGDAGLVTTNDAALAARIRVMRNHGSETKYYHQTVGGNFRLDALQAAVLRVKAPHLAGWTDARRVNAARYRRLFEEAVVRANANAGASHSKVTLAPASPEPTPRGTIVLPAERPDALHIFNQFVIRTGDRDGLRAHMTARGIGTEVYYPVPFHLQACFADLGYKAGDFPVAEAAAADSLALPIYGELTEGQQRYVVDSAVEYCQTLRP